MTGRDADNYYEMFKMIKESVILGTYTIEHIIFFASLVKYIISIQNHARANPWYAYCITTYDACN